MQEYWPSRKEVLEKLFQIWHPEGKTEKIQVAEARGRVIAENSYSVYNIPVVRASAKDGIGVDSALFAKGTPDTREWRPGIEYERADTGDDFDDRYDAVIPVEDVTFLPDGGILLKEGVEVRAGMNIKPSGSFVKKGALLASQWTKLTPSDLAALVMGGVGEIEVTKKPKVVFVPTGSELIPAGEKVERGKNIDSNSILVQNLLEEMGAEPICFPIVRDSKEELEEALDYALEQGEIILLNGGSSKGGEDFSATLLAERGEVICRNVAAAPGRPLCVALIDGKPVINLPGPAIACYYGVDWCVRAMVNALLHQEEPVRRTIPVRLTEEISYYSGMEILCKMQIQTAEQGYEGRQARFRGATVLENLIAPGYFVTDPERNCYRKGEIVEVELLREEGELSYSKLE